MNPRRFATVAAICGTVVLAGWVVAWLAGFGLTGIEHGDRRAASLTADAEFADVPQATALGNAAVEKAGTATISNSLTATDQTATDKAVASDELEPVVKTASADSSQMLPREEPLAQAAMASGVSVRSKSSTSAWSRISASIDTCGSSTGGPSRRTPSRCLSGGK